MCMHGVNDEERRVSVEGLDPEQLEEFLQARESLGKSSVPFPLFHGTDRNMWELEREDVPLFRENLWFAAKTLYGMLRKSPWKYSPLLFPHEEKWSLLDHHTNLEQEPLKEVMQWIMPDLLEGEATSSALCVASLDDALLYAPLAAHFGMIGHCASILAGAARTLFSEQEFSRELKAALRFVDVLEESPSRPVVLMFCALDRDGMVHADGSMVSSSEYQEAAKGKEQDWRYVKPLTLADGIPLQITGDNRDAFDEVLGKFGW